MNETATFTRRDSKTAYISDNLWLPKSEINVQAIQRSLEVYPEIQANYQKAGIRLWKSAKDHLIVPRNFIPSGDYGKYGFDFVDLRPTEFPRINIQHQVDPWDDAQAKAIQALQDAEQGLLHLACGKGKTTVALAAAANVGMPTIVIVNEGSLMTQWQNMIHEHWRYEGKIGIVQGKIFDWDYPITVAMIQTLAQKAEEWPADFRRNFGVAIFDEVHHLAAATFVRTADLFFGRRWGLTATPTREDGLEVAVEYHMGDIIFSDTSQTLQPETWFLYTPYKPASKLEEKELFYAGGQENISKIRGWLGRHAARNKLIINEIKKAAKVGRKILAITHSRDQAELLHERYEGSGLCIGKMDSKKRLQMLKERQVTFATMQIASEGLDAPALDTLFILTPFGNHNALQQCLGRIQRTHPGKKSPLAVVFEDNIKFCHALCGKLRQYLKKQSYTIKKTRRS